VPDPLALCMRRNFRNGPVAENLRVQIHSAKTNLGSRGTRQRCAVDESLAPGGPVAPATMEAIRSLLLTVTVLVFLALGGLVVVGGADGLYEGERLIRIERRRHDVFTWIVEPERRKQWVSGLVQSSQRSPSDLKVGSRFTEVVRFEGQEEEREVEVTVFEEGARFGYRTTLQGAAFEIVYEVGSHYTGSGSLLKVGYKIMWEGTWENLIEPVLSTRLRSRIEDELARLKQGVEESARQTR